MEKLDDPKGQPVAQNDPEPESVAEVIKDLEPDEQESLDVIGGADGTPGGACTWSDEG